MNLTFAMQTDLLLATQYFEQEVEKVQIRHNGKIAPFAKYQYNPSGGRCHYLTGWALMGLRGTDYRICGEIDLPERPGYRASKDYLHAWVKFSYQNNWYIYDPLESIIYPCCVWEETHQPRKITFEKTQTEILSLLLKEDCAYQIGESLWQLKEAKHLPQELAEEPSGYLCDVLAYSQIGYSYGFVNHYLAYRRSDF